MANAIRKYRSASVKTGWSVAGVANEVARGNPVILQWVNGVWPTYVKYWYTPSGTKIRAVNGQHFEVVVGFKGSKDNPTHFIMNDPWRGRRTLSISTVKSLWGWFGNTAIVVY